MKALELRSDSLDRAIQGLNQLVDLRWSVSGRQRQPQASLAAGHRGVADGGDEKTGGLQVLCDLKTVFLGTNHNWDNGRLWLPGKRKGGGELINPVPKNLSQFGSFFTPNDVDRSSCRSDSGGAGCG